MSANPLDSGFQAGPQSPFQAAPVAPLFVRDRYGSADSNSSNDDVNAKIRPSQEDARNPWAGEASTSPGRKPHGEPELPPADRGVKAWSILAGTFVFEALIWGSSSISFQCILLLIVLQVFLSAGASSRTFTPQAMAHISTRPTSLSSAPSKQAFSFSALL